MRRYVNFAVLVVLLGVAAWWAWMHAR